MARKGRLKEATKDVLLRPKSMRHYRELIMIVCEDEGTEPYYFGKFKEKFDEIFPNDTVLLIPIGTGRSSLGVVKRAIDEKQNSFDKYQKEVDEVWAVFDKDDHDKNDATRENFTNAFREATANDIKVAYSNECFELWFLLHLTNVDVRIPIPRHSDSHTATLGLYDRLENEINKGRTASTQFKYKHGSKDVVDLILQLSNERVAIERARQLDLAQCDKAPIDANPNTKVYLLVEHLMDLLDWYESGR